ncbi:MAG: CBS domain-containing protein [Pseudomonadales bacterium]|nr:CBS domain-containing protein [Pseudomonadales bacterium]
MQVESIMTEQVHTVAQSITLGELRKIFSQVNYHHLLVVENGQLLGVISDRDVLRMSSPYLDITGEDKAPLSAEDQELLDQTADSFMSKNLVTVLPDTLIDAAAILLLEHNISCLPILSEDDEVKGILTWKDMLKYYVYVR